MTLTLHVDSARWRAHVRGFVDQATASGVQVVPVTKGNGYGFGNTVIAREAAALQVPALAVGAYSEIGDVADEFPGDLLVLAPWRSSATPPVPVQAAGRIVHTVSRPDDLKAVTSGPEPVRVVIELLTGMRRHGVELGQLGDMLRALDGARLEGFALHLPLDGEHATQAVQLAERAYATLPDGPPRPDLWVSHLPLPEAAALATQVSARVRLRVATALWLGDRSALEARSTVLDAWPVRRGERFGYRQRRARRDGTILVVSGGTAHGVGLEAPTPAVTLRHRLASLARGGLAAAGRALSPFRVDGRQRWFAEPPHMQCSMIWLPAGARVPAIGDQVSVDVRMTTTLFDEQAWTPPPDLIPPSER